MGRPCICCAKASSSSSPSSSSSSGGSGSSGSISSTGSSGSGVILCLVCCGDGGFAPCSSFPEEEVIDCSPAIPPSRSGRCTCGTECECNADPASGLGGFWDCGTSDPCGQANDTACINHPELTCVCPFETGGECNPDLPGPLTNCIIDEEVDGGGNGNSSFFIMGNTGSEDTGTSGPSFFIEGASGATSEGPNLPVNGTTAALTGSSSSCHWAAGSASNITADDGSVCAGGSCTSGGYSNYLKSQGHGFSIPTGATIDGIEVRIDRQAGGTRHTDRLVQVTNGDGSGGYSATNLANATDWSNTGVYTYGGPTELWGETWTPAKINSFLFGVAVAVDVTSFFVATTADCDYIDVKVYYTP